MSSKKYHIDNFHVEELAAKLSKTIILDGDDEKKRTAPPPALPRIRDVKSFDDQIRIICESLFHTLTSKQLEATYQRCLAIDLQQAGIKVLIQEQEIKLQYKGQDVGTRRAVTNTVGQTMDGNRIKGRLNPNLRAYATTSILHVSFRH